MSSLVVLLCAVLYTSVTRLHNIYVHSENISKGKDAKQSSTNSVYSAINALDKAHAHYGSLTNKDNPSWWEVDLRGYFNISNITVTAASIGSSSSYYKPSRNKKVSEPFLTTSAMTAGDCGIVCHKHHSCIDFSYSATPSTDEIVC